MSDLVSGLRDLSACKHDDLSVGNEAADAIEQRDKWIQELQAALFRWLPHWRGSGSPMLDALGDDTCLLYGLESNPPEYGEQIYKELERHRALAEAVDRMMAAIGFHGEISARDDRVQAVMDALHKVYPK